MIEINTAWAVVGAYVAGFVLTFGRVWHHEGRCDDENGPVEPATAIVSLILAGIWPIFVPLRIMVWLFKPRGGK